ncbi:hypothetical protein [Dyadobacter flavalbus]|nr:hypothetical protein [Dyadobacter flavalbus]
MKSKILACCALMTMMTSCSDKKTTTDETALPSITGTWELVSSRVIAKGDTTVTYPVEGQEMIKMFAGNHFSFLKHDTKQGKGDSAVFDAGGGTYELKGEDYSEHLQYCNYREWENRDFHFKLRTKGDSLIQSGIEKIDSLNINQEILEIYVKKE